MAEKKEPLDRKLLAIAFCLSALATRPMLAQSPTQMRLSDQAPAVGSSVKPASPKTPLDTRVKPAAALKLHIEDLSPSDAHSSRKASFAASEPAPAKPAAAKPAAAKPAAAKPAEPVIAKPAKPETSKPANAETALPAKAEPVKPAQLESTTPAEPVKAEPAEPEEVSLAEPVTLSLSEPDVASSAEPVGADKVLDLIQFDDISLAEAMRLFAEQSGLNVITSAEAGKTKITVFLKNVTALDALEAIVKTNGLFYRVEENSGIVRIATLKEYEKDLASFREEQTRVFTLLYPNPSAVAQVIQQVFGNRVQMSRADADVEDLVDLSRRFSRFDLVDGRSLGLGGSGAGGNSVNQQAAFGLAGRNGLGGALSGLGMAAGVSGLSALGPQGMMQGMAMQGAAQVMAEKEHTPLDNMSADEIQRIENEVAREGQLSEGQRADLLERKEATIYVSTIRRNNQVIVRTGDSRSMEQIAQLIAQLDVPTPTVLLEVKVLRIVLADGFNSAFEYLGSSGNASLASSDSLAPAFPGAGSVSRTLGSGLGLAGNVPGALTFQVVDHNFRVRMQLLQSKNHVTALATPLILTANNEVSRIFVGDTLPFTVGFTPSQVLSSVGAVNGAVAATPITELRDVGQSLLITPNINADRTVTLRVVEENSERVLGGSSIPVPSTTGTGVTNVSVDTVRRRTISGTVVAQDGMAVALGGLIEENVSDAREQVPVLGNIPGLGMLFRRQASNRSRSELVVIVRPYVFNTPSESAATSELLLGELSTHPASPAAPGKKALNLPCRVTRSDAECVQRAKLFHLHNGATTSF